MKMGPLVPVINLVSRSVVYSFVRHALCKRPPLSLVNSVAARTQHNGSSDDQSYTTRKKELYEKFKSNELMSNFDEYLEDEQNVMDREFAVIKLEDFESLYKDDETGQTKKAIETVLEEYEFLKYNTIGRVPVDLSLTAMKEILTERSSPSGRERYFHYLFKREMAKRADTERKKRYKKEKSKIYQARLDGMMEKHGFKRTGLLDDNDQLIYGLWHNSLFCRVPENKMRNGHPTAKLVQAAQYGPKLVYDFAFDDFMTPWLVRNVAEQIHDSIGLNKYHYKEPFDFWFCNYDETKLTGKSIKDMKNTGLFEESLITYTKDCFTNHFDRSRLVYLSPNAKERLESVGKSDDVYVIGVYNDKGKALPLTYKKASELGIRCRSLPLDSFLAWNAGSKTLCINHVTGILLEYLANGGDWLGAFHKHVPSRKIKPLDLVIKEEEMRLKKHHRFHKSRY